MYKTYTNVEEYAECFPILEHFNFMEDNDMQLRKYKTLVGDFETTVYKGQVETEVWASAIVEIGTEDVNIFGSIDDTFEYLKSLNENIILYYHNLKFDGAFWLSYLLLDKGFKNGLIQKSELITDVEWKDDQDLKNGEIKYSISDMGQWYCIKIKTNGHIIDIRDSLKLLPFGVRKIGESFKTKHKKLDMEYKGIRYAGCEITPEEKEYIANDVLVVAEALDMMFNEGHKGLTIGSCCLKEFKSNYEKSAYNRLFPNVYDMTLDESLFGAPNVGEYIHKGYRGGWCYLVPEKANMIKVKGLTADVNSLYPSMMSSESGNYYPIGEPTFRKGPIPEWFLRYQNTYFFIRIKTQFRIKPGMLPFIQLKGNFLYSQTDSLESSDIEIDGEKVSEWIDEDGYHDTRVEMTLTKTDYILFLEHYDVEKFEILDWCYFETAKGLFDEYMEKYKRIKQNSKGAKRELAKLFLNNLYGKMAASTNSSFKFAYVKENGEIGFYNTVEHNKTPGYLPIGAAITSYARNFTIRAAQKNYYGKNERGFIYADTDSIHCDLSPEEVKGINVHPSDFCCWKLESCWDKAIFTRQKTYIEHVTHQDLEEIDQPYYNVKCAGMPEKCKSIFIHTFEDGQKISEKDLKKLSEKEVEFLSTTHSLEDFKPGLNVPGKLRPTRIKGGIVLVDSEYEMRDRHC